MTISDWITLLMAAVFLSWWADAWRRDKRDARAAEQRRQHLERKAEIEREARSRL